MTNNILPPDFIQRLDEILPQRPEALFEFKPWMALRINLLKNTIEEACAELNKRGVAFETVSFCPYAVIIDRKVQEKIQEMIDDGRLYPQGLESMLAVMILNPQPNESVLDLCAAPGSKTSQIAMLMNNQGTLKANDSVRTRLYRLKSVLQLTGSKAQLSSQDGRRYRENGKFYDRILVDAPCSSEGRFKIDDPDSVAYWSTRKIKEMSHKQKGLLLNASRLLAPGGTLVYSTCTFAPEENEEVIDWFLRKAGDHIKLAPASLSGVATYPCLSRWQKRDYDPRIQDALRILPGQRMEGFFIAKFVNSHYK